MALGVRGLPRPGALRGPGEAEPYTSKGVCTRLGEER